MTRLPVVLALALALTASATEIFPGGFTLITRHVFPIVAIVLVVIAFNYWYIRRSGVVPGPRCVLLQAVAIVGLAWLQ